MNDHETPPGGDIVKDDEKPPENKQRRRNTQDRRTGKKRRPGTTQGTGKKRRTQARGKPRTPARQKPRPDRSDASDTSDYEVGYGKPPLHTRFQPGQSGNPRGRRKGTRNLKTDLIEELSERILVREGGQARPIPKQRAVIKSLVNGTLKGDARLSGQLVPLMMRLLDTGEGTSEQSEPLHDDELEILEGFADRLQREMAKRNAPGRPRRRGKKKVDPTPNNDDPPHKEDGP